MTWLEPRLYCTVQYLVKTASGSLRIVSFKGFDFDKVSKAINQKPGTLMSTWF